MSQSQAKMIDGDSSAQDPIVQSTSRNPVAEHHPRIEVSTALHSATPSASSTAGAPVEVSGGTSGRLKGGNRVSKILGGVFRIGKSKNPQQKGVEYPRVASVGGDLGGGEGNSAALGTIRESKGNIAGFQSSLSPVMIPEARLAKGGNNHTRELGEMISKIAPSEADQKRDDEKYENLAARLGGQRLILQELKEIAGASDFLAPLKAFFGFTDSILKMMESVEAIEKKWKGLRDDIVDHLTYVRNDLKGSSSTKALGSDSPRLRYLKEYAQELTGIFNAYLLERGLSGDNVPQEDTVFTEYVKETGRFFKKASTVTLNMDKITSLQGRLARAFQNYERSKTTYIADRQFELWDAKIAELLRGDRPRQPFGNHAGSTISAGGMQHSKCHQHTRIKIREDIGKWAETSEAPAIYFICDSAGMGKSTVAYQMACDWDQSGHLAASFFFSRGTVGTFTFSDLIRHIAGRLWRREEVKNHPDMTYQYILGALDESRSMKEQWQHLVLRPLSILNSESAEDGRPLLLVIDAVDECSEGSREPLLHSLIELMDVTLSPYGRVKVLLTARPEPDITTTFRGSSLRSEKMKDHDAEAADVDLYVKDRFKSMGLSPEYAQRMSKYADGLFIFAATACDLLKKSKAKIRLLDGILQDQKPLRMDRLTTLYIGILRSKLDTDEYSKEVIQNILRIVLAVARPLLVSEIEDLLSGQGLDVAATIEDFMSVLGGGSETNPVYIRHPTFREFMLDSEISGEHGGVTIESAHQLLGLCCLTTMKRALKFNICGLQSSCMPNTDIQDLEDRIQKRIPGALRYSCMHWSSHLCYNMNPVDTDVSMLLGEFLAGEWLLFWLEVQSVMGIVPLAISALRRIKACIKIFRHLDQHLVDDALRFILAFFTPISTSTPHIYLSALPFMPTESNLWRNTSRLFPGQLGVLKGRVKSWATRPIEWRGHTSMIQSVAYSPDGRNVISGSNDRTIRIWDVETGEAVGDPLTGHTRNVNSVAYSPDGRHIASGSGDHTIRIWDAETGAVVGEPLTGHTDGVCSIAHSPNVWRLASGSQDCTIRIWDTETRVAVGEPLTGHTDSVHGVAYSPDGRHVVSGSQDNTVRIWDTKTGAAVGEPLAGHRDAVNSVTYSPNGRRVISGSEDRTIRIWDAETGETVGKPLKGHTGSVISVSCSPDGRRVISSSSDNTIRVWDAETGAAVGNPLTGHKHSVRSVAHSPDGRNIISGSRDFMIRTWDSRTGAAVGEPLAGHTGDVYSVEYSPDGRHIASGSLDRTIQIWDAKTGAAVGEPLTGHTNHVQSVAYSPDGRHIISGSRDCTIRIWDAETGVAVGEPLTGHTGFVLSVAYSPDSRNIISGSRDRTIRIWDAETGAAMKEPLKGHTDWIRSVAYSPDGRHILSGSDDQNIRIWEAETGAAVREPLTGHTGLVLSVKYSPDGRYIISGSSDWTIRIWDAETGAAVRESLKGHTDWIRSVAYSPDGRHIISGSSDCTNRIWDAETGAAVGEPLRGHKGDFNSVAYSPDGLHVVSGSQDCTIRIWDGRAKTDDDDHSLVLGSNDRPVHTKDIGNFTSLANFSGYVIPTEWLDSNGWVCGIEGLLFWVPEDCRLGLTCPAVMAMPNTGRHRTVRLDFTHFRYGSSWTEVYARHG